MSMMRKPPKYCQGFVDRHGKVRWYYRRPGFPRVALPGLPWSPTFMTAYEAAEQGQKIEIGRSLSKAGSITALVASFYASSDYKNLRPSTRAGYRGVIERFREEHGDKRAATLETRNVQRIISKIADTPAAANKMLGMIRLLMRHAIDLGLRNDDPTAGVRKVRRQIKGYPTWEEHHIDAFLAKHPKGSRAHLALVLMLYTGQRRSDVVRMGRQHIRDGYLAITQQKTGQDVHIPVHPELQSTLDMLPLGMTFLVTRQGKPFNPSAFTNWFRQMTQEAGLPDGLSPHGLRKATCRRLAEAGCTAHEIMAISGHKSLAEVTRYTIAAGRKGLAERAMATLDKTETKTSLDDYPTPPWATCALCEWLFAEGLAAHADEVREPAANRGHMVRPLREYFGQVEATDVHNYGAGYPVRDYLEMLPPPMVDWTITNPPFRLGEDFARRAIGTSRKGCALIVRSAFTEDVGRHRFLFGLSRPRAILQFTERVPMNRGRMEAGMTTATAYCWIIWTPAWTGRTQYDWIAPSRKRLERATDYAMEVG